MKNQPIMARIEKGRGGAIEKKEAIKWGGGAGLHPGGGQVKVTFFGDLGSRTKPRQSFRRGGETGDALKVGKEVGGGKGKVVHGGNRV